jgi:hypothetical protein
LGAVNLQSLSKTSREISLIIPASCLENDKNEGIVCSIYFFGGDVKSMLA